MKESIIIVTGGSGGLGRHIVNKYALSGHKVYIPTRNPQKVRDIFDRTSDDKESYKIKKIYAFECDTDNESSISDFVSSVTHLENNKIDILINALGGIHDPFPVHEIESRKIIEYFSLNFMSAFWFTKYSLKYMRDQNFGRLVYIGSVMGINPAENRLAYSVSKSSLKVLMETVSKENMNFNITANIVTPGVIDTPANREWGTPEDILSWNKPEDIADVIYNITESHYNKLNNTIIKLYGDI